MIAAKACAKVNLSLSVARTRGAQLHPINGLFLSVSWVDRLWIGLGEDDLLEGVGGRAVPGAEHNLAWLAARAVRSAAGRSTGLHVRLDKRIPVAAGLGGGSADAAASLAVAGRLMDVPRDELQAIAPDLGSDVPFCLAGGFAEVAGVGERITTLEMPFGFALAVVVPPIEVPTRAVYAAWDLLESRGGRPIDGRDLPPALREWEPLVNDLTPAAIDVAPAIADWRDELESAWGRPVALSGSGPSLFGYFSDVAEADDALGVVPVGARATRAVVPVPLGWVMEYEDGEFVDSSGRKLNPSDDGVLLTSLED